VRRPDRLLEVASNLQPSDCSSHPPIYWCAPQNRLQVHIDELRARKSNVERPNICNTSVISILVQFNSAWETHCGMII